MILPTGVAKEERRKEVSLNNFDAFPVLYLVVKKWTANMEIKPHQRIFSTLIYHCIWKTILYGMNGFGLFCSFSYLEYLYFSFASFGSEIPECV